MIKKLCKQDDNLLSFLCGIFSNIPISLLLTVGNWGNNWIEHVYFLIWIGAFIVSIVLTVFAFKFTLCKISIQKVIDKVQGEQAKQQALDIELDKKHNKKKLKVGLIGFFVCAIVICLSLIALWVLGSI